MNLNLLREQGRTGDIILIGGNSFLARLIKYGQKTQTIDGKSSQWCHAMLLYNSLTVFESTMDFEPYPAIISSPVEGIVQEQKYLDNGVQLNYLENHKGAEPALLLKFPFSDKQRQLLTEKMDKMLEQGYTYPIGGLIGSLLSYWIFRGWKSNPLQGKRSLYCSAAVQEVYSALGIDFDPNHTARNTSPEIISQFQMEGLRRIKLC